MVLEKRDESRSLKTEGRRAAIPVLPRVPLALIQESPLGQRHELLGRSRVVGVVRLTKTGRGDAGGVVKVVVPDGIEAEASLLPRTECPDILRFILPDTRMTGREPAAARARRDIFGKYMLAGGIEIWCVASNRRPSMWNSLTQYAAFDEKRPHVRGVVVEVDGLAPLRRMPACEVLVARTVEVVAVRPQVVVDDIAE